MSICTATYSVPLTRRFKSTFSSQCIVFFNPVVMYNIPCMTDTFYPLWVDVLKLPSDRGPFLAEATNPKGFILHSHPFTFESWKVRYNIVPISILLANAYILLLAHTIPRDKVIQNHKCSISKSRPVLTLWTVVVYTNKYQNGLKHVLK